MSLIMHWLHLLAVVAWIGGLTYIVFIFFPVVAALDPVGRATLAPRLIRRFLVLVWTSVGVLLITGLYRIFVVQQMFDRTAWLQTGYGHSLMTKLVLYLLLVGVAVHVTVVLYPPLRNHMREHLAHPTPTACTICARFLKKARRMMWIGWGMGIVTILLAARLRGA